MDFDLDDFIHGVPWARVAACAGLVVCGGMCAVSGVGLALAATSHEATLSDLDAQIEQAKAERDEAASAESASSALVGSTDTSATATGAAIAEAQGKCVSSTYVSAGKQTTEEVSKTMSKLVSDDACTGAWATISKTTSDVRPEWEFLSSTAFDATVESLDVAWRLADSDTGVVYGWTLGTYDVKDQSVSGLVIYSTKAGRESGVLTFADGCRSIDESLDIKSLLGVG